MKFSVILPVYNKADTVGAAIESVLAQTVDDYELIVVDDGSTDAVDRVLARYPSIRIIRQENAGVSAARNAGIDRAEGEFLCFLDSDDAWLPHHLATLSDLMLQFPTADYFITGHREHRPDGTLWHSSHALAGYDDTFLCGDLPRLLNRTSYGLANTNSMCVRKRVLDEDGIRFEPGAVIGEDTDVWYRLALRHPAAVVKEETTVYHRERSTATRNASHVHDWVFARREQAIMADRTIEPQVKASVIALLDRYKLADCRRYMAEGDRAKARRLLRQVTDKKGRRYILSALFCLLPCSLCRKLCK